MILKEVKLTVLDQHQYCVVLDPISSDGKQQLGKRVLRQGPTTFFLKPGMICLARKYGAMLEKHFLVYIDMIYI